MYEDRQGCVAFGGTCEARIAVAVVAATAIMARRIVCAHATDVALFASHLGCTCPRHGNLYRLRKGAFKPVILSAVEG